MIFIIENPTTDHSGVLPIERAYREKIDHIDERFLKSSSQYDDWKKEGKNHSTKETSKGILYSRTIEKEVWLIELDLDSFSKLLKEQYLIHHTEHEISFSDARQYPTLRLNCIY